MITPEQMEEWLREVEERPSSGALIVRLVTQRLKNLTERNEELLSENILLRSGQKVEDYEKRIASLEYQLDLLRRQFGGEIPSGAAVSPAAATINLILYNPKGQVIRAVLPQQEIESGRLEASFRNGANLLAGGPVRLLVSHDYEELLFVFDSGRTQAMAVAELQVCASKELDWSRSFLAEPHAGEELATVAAIGKMSLFDFCIQTSRRGCVKRMMRSSFETHLARSYIGSGIKQSPDKTCALTFCNKEDRFTLATREGYLLTTEASQLSYTIEEMMKLSTTDYLVNAFVTGQKPSVLVVTSNAKVVHRQTDWLELAASTKTKGQAVFSQSRREGGTRVVGAAAVSDNDWGLALNMAGELSLHRAADLMANGAIPSQSELVEFITFELQS